MFRGNLMPHYWSFGGAGMWVILLEAAVALGLLLVIVWATWPKRRESAPQDPKSLKNTEEDHTRHD